MLSQIFYFKKWIVVMALTVAFAPTPCGLISE